MDSHWILILSWSLDILSCIFLFNNYRNLPLKLLKEDCVFFSLCIYPLRRGFTSHTYIHIVSHSLNNSRMCLLQSVIIYMCLQWVIFPTKAQKLGGAHISSGSASLWLTMKTAMVMSLNWMFSLQIAKLRFEMVTVYIPHLKPFIWNISQIITQSFNICWCEYILLQISVYEHEWSCQPPAPSVEEWCWLTAELRR